MGIVRAYRAAARRDASNLRPRRPEPRGCGNCGRLFASESAWACHFEDGPGSRCLPESALGGVLAEVDGVWVLRGTSY